MNNLSRIILVVITLIIIGFAGLLWSTLGVDQNMDTNVVKPRPTIGQVLTKLSRTLMNKTAVKDTAHDVTLTPTPDNTANKVVNPLDGLTPDQLNHVPSAEERAEALKNIQWPPDDTIDWQARAIYLDKFGVDVTESPVPVWLPEPGLVREIEGWFPREDWMFANLILESTLSISIASTLVRDYDERKIYPATFENPDVGGTEYGCSVNWFAEGKLVDIVISSSQVDLSDCRKSSELTQFIRSLKYLGGKGH